MIIRDLGKAHRIHATMNKYEEKHQCMIADKMFSILIDPWAAQSFISSVAPKIIKVKAVEQDEFRYVELASRAKKKVGG